MLAAAVVLAIALIGTARPAVGIEKASATTTVGETAAPAANVLDLALPAAEGQETQTEKATAQEKEKEKAAVGKPVVVSIKEIDQSPIVITITEGDVVKKMTLAKPLTITSGKDGNSLILTSEGEEIQVLKGEPLRLEIKGGAIEFIKEGKALKVGGSGVYTIVKEGDKDGRKIVFYGTPEGKAIGLGRVHVMTEGKDEKGGVRVVVGTEKESEPAMAWTIKEPGKKGDLWVAKEFSGKPGASAVWVAEGGKAFAFSPAGNKELLEKVRAIQEQLAAVMAKKMDIAALEGSLKKLEAELQANEEKLDKLKIKLEKAPGEYFVTKRFGEGEAKSDVAVWLTKSDEASASAKVMIKDGNTIQIVVGGKGTGPEDYERVAANLKKEMPAGYKLVGQEFDAENGMMTFKLSAPEGKTVDEQTVRKLVEGLKTEVKTKK